MTLPLYQFDAFGRPFGLVLAVLLGFAFGFVLERAGFGRSTILAAQFYFRDMRVLKVMFTAIVTAAAGLQALSVAGVLDLSAVVVPDTWIWPHLFGGFLLGVGFILAGYCPGTSVVATASGHLDGLATLAGVVLGSIGYAFCWPLVAGLHRSGALGMVTLDGWLGIPRGVLVLAVALMAAGAFLGAERIERHFELSANEPAPALRRLRNTVVTALGFVAVLGLLPAARTAATESVRPKPMNPWTLARGLVLDPTGFELIDLRVEPRGGKPIPGARRLEAGEDLDETAAALPPGKRLVLILGRNQEPPKFRPGREVFVLEGGYQRFAGLFLSEPKPAEAQQDLGRYEERRALFEAFTGARAKAVPRRRIRRVRRKRLKKDGGCG